ncbi:MAG: TolC family protein [Myxococcales bacterium]|nr:TolC family protein [Myxococcales bacterium]
MAPVPVPALTSTITASFSGDAVVEEEVLASILRFHPEIEAAIARRDQAQGDLLAARGGFDPRLLAEGEIVPQGYYDYRRVDAAILQPTPFWGIEVLGGYRVGLPDDVPSFAPYNEDFRDALDRGELRGEIKIPVYRGGPIDKRRAAIRKERIRVERLEAEIRSERLFLSIEGIRSYWSWRAAVAKLRFAEQLADIAKARDEAVGQRVREGSMAPIERLEATRALRERQQQVIEAEQKALLSALKLGLFLRGPEGEPLPPTAALAPELENRVEDLDPRRRDQAYDAAVAGRPELEALRRKMSELEVQVELNQNQLFPKLDFKAKLSSDFGENTVEPGREDELEPTELKLGLELDVPLLFREARGELAAARAEREELRQKIRFTIDKLQAEVASAWVVLQTSQRNARIAIDLRELAEAVAAGERRRFEVGATDLFTVFLRETSAFDAASKAIDALATQRAADTIFELSTCGTRPAHEALGIPPC